MTLRSSLGFASVLAAMLFSQPALAKTERIGPFVVSDEAPEVIVLSGDITSTAPLDFKSAILQQPEAKVVVLSSDGGSVMAGLLLADEIHLRGLSTYVPKGAGCFSACSYIFFAGKGRVTDGELGVHQFSGPKGDADLASAQYTVANILDILGKFHVPAPVISRMLKTDPQDMYVFSASEVVDLKINRDSHLVEPSKTAIAALPKDLFKTPDPQKPTRTASTPEPNTIKADEPLFAIYNGLDFYGGDIRKLNAKSFAACLMACIETKACVSITFNAEPKYRRTTNCFLKDLSVDRPEPYDKAISATFEWPEGDGVIRARKQSFRPIFITKSDLNSAF